MEADCIIRNGSILDGSGAEAYRADVGVKDGTITAIGTLSDCTAETEIDASGKTVTPGFLDLHRHADAAVFRDGFGEAELLQGLTSIVNGNCGLSLAPIEGEYADAIKAYLRPVTGAFGDCPTERLSAYADALRRRPLPLHMGMLAGMGTIRACIAGFRPTLEQEDEAGIRRLLEQTLSDGALGVSLGLGYAPECFSDTEELIRLLQPIRGTQTVLSAHMRSESMNLLDSIDEVLTLAKALRVPLEISHLKAVGRAQWGSLIHAALEKIRRAREDGIDVMCDAYPYTAGSTQLCHVLPPEFLRGGVEAIAERLRNPAMQEVLRARFETGRDYDNYAMLIGWENIRISSVQNEADRRYLGKTVAEATGETEPWRFAAELLAREKCAVTMIDRLTHEDDIAAIYRAPFSYVISDATYPTEGDPHPRVYGAFAHVLERFVNEKHAISLAEAVRKMTRLPADRYGLLKKGRIEVGADADILVFDPKKVHAKATFDAPRQCAAGFDTVLVGGTVAVRGGKRTGKANGSILERV